MLVRISVLCAISVTPIPYNRYISVIHSSEFLCDLAKHNIETVVLHYGDQSTVEFQLSLISNVFILILLRVYSYR